MDRLTNFWSILQGILQDGKEIAVKRLASSSGQGIEEVKNEMILFSKLQHRNLARLLGYCIDKEEKLLVYEFMPNKSLDSFIFGWYQKAMLAHFFVNIRLVDCLLFQRVHIVFFVLFITYEFLIFLKNIS